VVGLGGDSTAALVEIRWPSGAVQTFADVKAAQTLTATEPAASANGFAAPAAFANGVGEPGHPPPLTEPARSVLRRDLAEALAKAGGSNEPSRSR